MKKIAKILPLFAALPLMAGCSSNKVKTIEFQNNGSQLEFEAFKEAIEEVKLENEFYKESDSVLRPMIKTTYRANTSIIDNRRNDKIISQSDEQKITNLQDKYDTSSLVSQSTEVEHSSKSAKDSYGRSSSSASSKKINGLQRTFHGEHVYFASVDHIRKEYGPYQIIDGDHKAEDVFENWIKFGARSSVKEFELHEYVGEDEEEAKRYTYYRNENVFTIEYSLDEEEEFKSTVGEEELVDYVISTNIRHKYQIDFSNGRFSYKCSEEDNITTSYKRSYDQHIIGDTLNTSDKNYANVSFETGDVKLKETDLSKYVKIGFPQD
ncbi:MAG: hypothetical protein K6E11_00850 [Bacilli bacterium]|nr:hypothetical protein [Bacilli bacterium]